MLPNLKLQLWNLGLRQNQLAQMLDLDETVVSRIINGFREPNQEVRHRIAELLAADEQWLFDKPSAAPHSGSMRRMTGAAKP